MLWSELTDATIQLTDNFFDDILTGDQAELHVSEGLVAWRSDFWGHYYATIEYPDSDVDGLVDAADNCPLVSNEDQADFDNDEIGDLCDSDMDNDGVDNLLDACPLNPAESVDSDSDLVCDGEDAFPSDPAESADTDSDGVGDNADAFPSDPLETLDTDLDGTGDNADLDDDGDGLADTLETILGTDPKKEDSDGDGLTDSEEIALSSNPLSGDTDEDGTGDFADNCPIDPNETQRDFDEDGIGNPCDPEPYPVPEPGFGSMIAVGGMALAFAKRQRKAAASRLTR
jgi:hypothetical protein